jgi:hypothetical protein
MEGFWHKINFINISLVFLEYDFFFLKKAAKIRFGIFVCVSQIKNSESVSAYMRGFSKR